DRALRPREPRHVLFSFPRERRRALGAAGGIEAEPGRRAAEAARAHQAAQGGGGGLRGHRGAVAGRAAAVSRGGPARAAAGGGGGSTRGRATRRVACWRRSSASWS